MLLHDTLTNTSYLRSTCPRLLEALAVKHLHLGRALVGARLIDKVPRHDRGVVRVCAPIDGVDSPAHGVKIVYTQ